NITFVLSGCCLLSCNLHFASDYIRCILTCKMQVRKKRPLRARDSAGRAGGPVRFARSPCPIANLLDIVGDKWSLLVARDLLRGRTTYGQMLDSPTQIPTNILFDRLKRLYKDCIITRSTYDHTHVHYDYQLTKKGRNF